MANRKRKFNDLGLGSKASAGGYRVLNKDGTFNVRKENVPFWERQNFFHALVNMSWGRFFLLVLVGYIVVNLLFACIYVLIGVEHIDGMKQGTGLEQFAEAFFFSSQTITTLGYGRMSPVGMLASTVAAFESMLGLLSFALATGLLYGRFSRAPRKLKYSSHAVLAPYQEINGFMFRLLNPRRNQLLEAKVTLTVSMDRPDSNLRQFHLLELERSSVVFLPSVWTVVHPITDDSPLKGMTVEDLKEKNAEFIVSLKAFDESSSDLVYSRTSYKAEEILPGRKFTYIIERGNGGIAVDVSRLDETEEKPLNP